MTARLDIVATQGHYADHLIPTWLVLPEERRGMFYTLPKYAGHIRAQGVEPVTYRSRRELGRVLRETYRLTLVAAYRDLRVVNATNRPVVYSEHGNGQTFTGKNHPSYAGATDRENVVLFLVPAQRVADRITTGVPAAVVGCPKLDRWHPPQPKPRSSPPVVSIAWHWDAQWLPETRSAWPHYSDVLPRLKAMQDAGEIRVLGHGHPHIIEQLIPHFRRHGLAWTRNFERVMTEADVYVNDASSTLYEFASLDRPTVVMNAPWYRRDVEHGLRFWEHADVGVQVDEPEHVPDAIRAALIDPPVQRERRKEGVVAAYGFTDGHCAERAAQAILDVLDTMPVTDERVETTMPHFKHTITGSIQQAREGSRVYERFVKSPYWEEVQTETVKVMRPDDSTPKQIEVAVPEDINHVGGGYYELPDGTRVKGKDAAIEAMATGG